MRRLLLLPLLVAFAAWPGAASASSQHTVDVVKVDGVIDHAMGDYLLGTLAQAEREGSTVVIQLDTPGTLNYDGLRLANRVFEAKVPVIVWVGPSGARATGAGFMLVYAASLSVTSPGSGIGPLSPLDLARKASLQAGKAREAVTARMQLWADARRRASPFQTSRQAFTAYDALSDNVAECARDVTFTGHNARDCAAISIPDLLRKLDGRRVPTEGGAVTLATRGALVRFHELGVGRRVLHTVASPVAIYVLLVLGLAGLAFEVTQSGVGFAGIAGGVAIGLAGYGLAVVPFRAVGLGLLLAGPGLFTLDVLLRRLGALSLAGLVAFTFGSFLMFRDVAPAVDLPIWLIAGALVASILYYGFGLTVAVKARERIVSTQVGLVGLVGETRGTLAPDGPVFVKGALWRGRSGNGPIPPGTKVRVRGVDGLILRVEPEDPS